MSLDVYLNMPDTSMQSGSGIFIRDNGATKEISRAEWDARFPGRAPIVVQPNEDSGQVYSRNITHNLGGMAREAGIYNHLWRPDELGITKAVELIVPLRDGLALLQSDPARFEILNPPNGWGNYDGLVDFVSEYLAACQRYPDATVSVSR